MTNKIVTLLRVTSMLSNSSDASCEQILSSHRHAYEAFCIATPDEFAAQCLSESGSDGLFGSYLVFWHCTANANPLALTLLVPWLVMLLLALGSTADVFLMPQLHYLSAFLRLSPDVAGVTLLAVGNGAPDVFSGIAVATGSIGSDLDLSLMLADIISGTLFIMTVVMGSVILVASSRAPGWTVGKLPFWRDTIALIIAVSTVLKIAGDGIIYQWEALSFLGLHAVYIIAALTLPKLARVLRRGGGRSTSTSMSQSILRQSFISTDSRPLGADVGGLGPLGGVTANVGGSPLPPLAVLTPLSAAELHTLPVSRASLAVEPLQLEPQSVEASRRHVSRAAGADAQRLQWLWGEWGVAGEGGVGAAIGLPAGANAPMAGLDSPEKGSGPVSWVLWVLELPLSLCRWATIPSSDGEWDRRRRLWTAATPPLAACLVAVEVYSNMADGGSGSDCANATNSSFDAGATFDAGAAADAPERPSLLLALLTARLGNSGIPAVVVLLGAAAPLCALVYVGSQDRAPPRWQPVLVMSGFLMTVVWLDRIAAELIALIETFGVLFGLSTTILGLTIIAIANSFGDFVADTASAREGTVSGARMAMAACFGSPVIMNIVTVGLSFTIRLVITGGQPICFSPIDTLARLGYLLFYLTIASHLLVFPLCGYRAPRIYALYLFCIYGTLLAGSVLLEAKVVDDGWLCAPLEGIFGPCNASLVETPAACHAEC